MPVVSIVMAAYNAADTLPSAIDGILTQTFQDFEFIIVDDGSSDASAEILSRYANQDSRIRVLTQANTGLTRALNNGLSIATGIYVARHDADDLSMPTRLEKQVDYLNGNESVVLVGSDCGMIDESGECILVTKNSQKKQLAEKLDRSNPFVHGSIMFRRIINGIAVSYDDFYKKGQDYDLVLRLAEAGAIHIIPEELYRFRFSRTGIVITNVTFYGTRAKENYLRRRAGLPENRTPPTEEEIRPRPSEGHFNYSLGMRYLSAYNTTKARHALLTALKNIKPGDPLLVPCLKLLLISCLPASVLRYLRER